MLVVTMALPQTRSVLEWKWPLKTAWRLCSANATSKSLALVGRLGRKLPMGKWVSRAVGRFLSRVFSGVGREGQRVLVDGGLAAGAALGGIGGDKLPAAVLEEVVDGLGEVVFEGLAVVVAGLVVVVADADVEGHFQGFEDVVDGGVLLLGAVFGHVAEDDGEVGLWSFIRLITWSASHWAQRLSK